MGKVNPVGDQPELRLVAPDGKFAATFLEMAEEFQASGEPRYEKDLPLLRTNFPAFLERLDRASRGENLPIGYVPGDEFWLLEPRSQRILGIIRLRHWLTPALEERGGHIGYAIRPGERRKGYGAQILAMLLAWLREPGWQAARGLNLRRVLLTCDTNNTASARIIEANGGVLENRVRVENDLVSRYWIDLGARREGRPDG